MLAQSSDQPYRFLELRDRLLEIFITEPADEVSAFQTPQRGPSIRAGSIR